MYSRCKDPRLIGFTYSDWGGSVDDKKSTSGYAFSLGTSVVTWASKKQQAIALSSTEAECRGVVKGACKAVWLRRMLANVQIKQRESTPLLCDNQGVIKLAKNPVFHERTKHLDLHCHFIIQLVDDGSIELQYCPTKDQTADIFTKSLGLDKHVKFRDKLGIVSKLTI